MNSQQHLMQPKDDIMNYYYFEHGLSDADINQLLAEIHQFRAGKELETANVNGIINPDYRDSRICWLPRNKFEWLYETISRFITDANNDLYGFLLYGTLENIQYTEYSEDYKGHYDWHTDLGAANISFRKLSLSIQLSGESDYEGGDLQFFIDRDIIVAPKGKGDVILFPSFMTHRVQPVTKGIRKCLVIWASGPPFM